MAGTLQVDQPHDRDEAADMQAVGGGIEATIGADGPGTERVTQSIGMLEEELAPSELEERGWKFRHPPKIGTHGAWRAPAWPYGIDGTGCAKTGCASTFTPR